MTGHSGSTPYLIDRISSIVSIDNRDPDSTPRALFTCLSGRNVSFDGADLLLQYERTMEVLQNKVLQGTERNQAEHEANLLYIAGGIFGGNMPDQLNDLKKKFATCAGSKEPPMPEKVVETATQLINRAARLGQEP